MTDLLFDVSKVSTLILGRLGAEYTKAFRARVAKDSIKILGVNHEN